MGVFQLAGFTGCLAIPKPTEALTRDLVERPDEFRALYFPRSGGVDHGWLESFGDERLIELVEEAIERNYNLFQAAAVREQALAAVRLARSGLLPRLDGFAGLERDEGSVGSEDLFWMELRVSWEMDLWGRLRAGTLAAEQSAVATSLEYDYLRQSLAALVAETWFAAIAARRQVEINLDRVQSEQTTAGASATRAEAGAGMPLDHDFAQANLAFAREELAASEAAYLRVVRALELLLGRYPSAALDAATTLPAMPEMPGVGIPAELLERRPDLVAAEARVAAAFYRVHASRLARLPRLRLFASGGFELSPAESVWTLAADLFAPLFTAGEITAQIDIATAQQRAAMAAYVQSALNAFGEVENAIANQRYLEQRERELSNAIRRLASANTTAQARYEAGVLTIFELNQIRQNYFRAQSQLVTVQLDSLRQRILLHLALGGSFDAPELSDHMGQQAAPGKNAATAAHSFPEVTNEIQN